MTIFVFLTSFSGCWLLVYRNTIDLYTLIFHPVVLLNSVILIDFIGSLGFSTQKIVSSVNTYSCTSFFFDNLYAFTFQCICLYIILIALSPWLGSLVHWWIEWCISQGSPEKQIYVYVCVCWHIQLTMKTGWSGNLCLIPHLRGKELNSFKLRMMLTVEFL